MVIQNCPCSLLCGLHDVGNVSFSERHANLVKINYVLCIVRPCLHFSGHLLKEEKNFFFDLADFFSVHSTENSVHRTEFSVR